jgi:GxxExxY protein
MEIHTTELGRRVIGCAIEVHSALGPGLLESAYERCLDQEFRVSGLGVVRQLPLPVSYKGVALDCGYRVDFLVEGDLIVELKTVDRILPIHQAQALTYLRLLGVRQAFLMNFNVRRMVDGIKSILL